MAGDMARQTMPQALRIMKLIASGVDLLGGDDQVALVLAVLVVDEDDHAAGPQFGQGLLDGAETCRRSAWWLLRGKWRRCRVSLADLLFSRARACTIVADLTARRDVDNAEISPLDC